MYSSKKESYRECIEAFIFNLEESLCRIQDDGEYYCDDFRSHSKYLKKGISRIELLLSYDNGFCTHKAKKEMANLDFFIQEHASYLDCV